MIKKIAEKKFAEKKTPNPVEIWNLFLISRFNNNKNVSFSRSNKTSWLGLLCYPYKT